MWSSKRKRTAAKIDTLIGSEACLTGDLNFSGGLHIDGVVKGNINSATDSPALLSLSAQAVVEGEIDVSNMILNGTVVGSIRCSERLEIGPTARITGDTYYNVLEIAGSAQVNGRLICCREQDGAPPQAMPDESAPPK